MAEEKTIIIEVDVESTKLEKAEKLLESNKRARQELNKEIKNSNVVTDEQIKKRVELQKTQKKLTEIRNNSIKSLKAESGSINASRLELSKQVKERNNLNKTTVEGAKRFEELQDSIAGLNEEISKDEQKGGDFRRNVGNYPTLLGKASGAIKGFGVALAAIGIGAIIALLAKFSEILQKNQVVADFFATALEAVEIIISDLVNFLIDNREGVVSFFKDIFENPVKNIKALGQAIKENLIGRFDSLIKGAGLLGDVFVKLFEGDFKGALDVAGEAALELGDAFLLIQPTAVIEGVKDLTSVVSDYTSQVLETAQANVALANSAALVEANNKLLFESFDQQAEVLRQIRDEERNSIDDRIKANNDLSEVLEKQQQLQLEQQRIAIASAEAQVAKNKNTETEVALTEALAEEQAILADIEGRRSEQLSNDLGLNREKLELEQSLSEAVNKRTLEERNFQAEQIENDELRREALLENLDFELQIEQERLGAKINAANEGTQAIQDAQQELLDFELAIDQQRSKLQSNAANEEIKRSKLLNKTKQKLGQQALKDLSTIAGEGEGIQKAFALTEIGIDTAKAIAGLTAASEANPANAVTFGGAGVAQFAAGIIRIIANIASATKLLGKSTSVPSGGGGGGGVPATPSTSGGGLANVNASLLSQFSTDPSASADNAEAVGEAAQNTPAPVVSVVEITDAQTNVETKVTESTLG